MSDLLAFPTARRQSRASLLGTWMDGGTLRIYDGTQPASPDDAVTTQVLLAEFTLPDPAGTATDGVFGGELPDAALIAASGTASWGRCLDDLGATVWDGMVGATGSGAAIEVDSVSFLAGAYAAVTAITITEG
jgi:hypothetical protein